MTYKMSHFSACLVVGALMSVSLPTLANEAMNSAPTPAAEFSEGESAIELTGPTVEEIRAYLQQKHQREAKSDMDADQLDHFRIQKFDPASAAGRIVIKAHKSNDTSKPEYLEVFRQRSADPTDLDPILIFEGGKSHKTLVSTAGTYGAKRYTTPSGTFGIDSMEPMHYSSRYNNAPMPWTLFFNGGIAIHGATPSEYKALGRKASHGCVRVHPDNAKLIYDLVRNEGRSSAIIQVLEE